jgi:prophage DNA circulation protein
MFTFIGSKTLKEMQDTIKVLQGNVEHLYNQVRSLQAKVQELSPRKSVTLSSTAKASGSGITYTAKPKRGRPFGSTAKPKTKK